MSAKNNETQEMDTIEAQSFIDNNISDSKRRKTINKWNKKICLSTAKILLILLSFIIIITLIYVLSNYEKFDKKSRFIVHPYHEEVDNLVWISFKTYKKSFNSLKTYLKRYELDSNAKNLSLDTHQCNSDNNFYCFLLNETFNTPCVESQYYGYKLGNPCVLINLDPVMNWKLNEVKDNSTHYLQLSNILINISCDGETAYDKEAIGWLEYFPTEGIDYKYFSATYGSKRQLLPFIFVHFRYPTIGVLISIECEISAQNKLTKNKIFKANVKFQLLLDF